MQIMITYIPKKGTKTMFLGSDGKEYRKCQKDDTFFIGKCPLCEAEKEAIQAGIEKRKEDQKLIKQKKYELHWKHCLLVIEEAKNWLNIGIPPNIVTKSIFFNERNAPYELSHTYRLGVVKPFGKVTEHINGRETIGYYQYYAILKGDINNSQELEKWYEQYCGHIKTDKEFNDKIKKYQDSKKDGAISPDTYIDVLKEHINLDLSFEEKEELRSRFLYSKYKKILKHDIIKCLQNAKT